ncbi:MAG TPA: urease accessory UreF family protein [Stellaceae bacterium]|nr:urease accessory UreF family protein [Stellaceae bacterium]
MSSTITDAAFYRLLTWLSPAYPLGAFSFSHGIEYAVEARLVGDGATLAAYAATTLEDGAGFVDAALLAAAWRAARDPDRLDMLGGIAAAWRGTAEFALESETQGRAFLATTRAAWPHPELEALAGRWAGRAPALPVALGVACALHQIALPLAVSGFLHAFAANLVSAGVRLIPLGQTDGQRIVAALAPAVGRAGERALGTPLDAVTTCAPLIDRCSMRHETQYTRLFRS